MHVCASAIIILIIAITITIIGVSIIHDKNKRNWLLGILVTLILWLSLFSIGYINIGPEYDYYYTIDIKSNSISNYTILLPIPDDKIINELHYSGVTFQIEETQYGKMLNVTSAISFNITVWIDNADSCELSSQSNNTLNYYIFLDKEINNSIFLDFHYLPRHYGDDFDDIIFNGKLEDGWNIYKFESVWG